MRIYTHSSFYQHDTGIGHPESTDRLDAAVDGVQRAAFDRQILTDPEFHPDTPRIVARVHSEDYQRSLDEACRAGYRLFHSMDNPISAGSHRAAMNAVSIALRAADDLWNGSAERRAFVIARPPGHHAVKNEAMGFCFFNTIACVAEKLLERDDVERVFILDWDVHHGNGTQELFEERDDVFYASLHRFPFYPGTGAADEIGTGAGRGLTRNIPLEGGTGDAKYLQAIEEIIVPLIDDYRPQAILVSAGFDAHRRDPLGGMRVTEQAFGEMTRRVVECANRHAGGRLLTLLEGGYDPLGLATSVEEHLLALAE
jgi:acetoin utilization deacetylase AcuC-like enzyme